MTDLAPEKWQELSDKLSAELADADELLALRRKVWKRMLLAGVIALCAWRQRSPLRPLCKATTT